MSWLSWAIAVIRRKNMPWGSKYIGMREEYRQIPDVLLQRIA